MGKKQQQQQQKIDLLDHSVLETRGTFDLFSFQF